MQPEKDQEHLKSFETYIASGDHGGLTRFLEGMSPAKVVWMVSRLGKEDQKQLFSLLSPADAAELLDDLPNVQAAGLVEALPPENAAAIVDEMSRYAQAAILSDISTSDAHAILEAMSPEEAKKTRERLQYPKDTAGGLMATQYLAYHEGTTIAEVLTDIQRHRDKYSDYAVQYAYVISADGCLLGVIRLRDLVLAKAAEQVSAFMIKNPLHVLTTAPLKELVQLFERHPYFGIPVIDETGMLIGVVARTRVAEAASQQAHDSFLKVSGVVGGEEFRSMPLFRRSFRRLSWLSINIVLNIIAASVIALYTDTLSAVIALAVFLPIISDMSGCSGNQAVAVSIRELTVGLLRPYEVVRVLLKEIGIGLANGLSLGVLLGGVALLWKGNPWLGVVVGGAMAANTVVAVCLGGVIPLLLQRMRIDPALASGPILTTVTDMCGFFFVLSFATAALRLLS